jgi:large subunit ribosomal protein L18
MQKSQLKRQNGIARRHRRVRGKIKGSETRPRLMVFRSNKNIEAQVINDVTHTTICGVSTLSADFKKSGKKSSTSEGASEIGKMIAAKAQKAGVSEVVFDRGGNLYHGRVKALAEAAREAGLKF